MNESVPKLAAVVAYEAWLRDCHEALGAHFETTIRSIQ